MVNLMTVGARAKEGVGYQTMYKALNGTSIDSKGNSRVLFCARDPRFQHATAAPAAFTTNGAVVANRIVGKFAAL